MPPQPYHGGGRMLPTPNLLPTSFSGQWAVLGWAHLLLPMSLLPSLSPAVSTIPAAGR